MITHGGDEQPTPRVETRVAGAHSRGELGVLGKRPLDLLEQPLLVLRERHGTPPRSSQVGPRRADRPWQPTGCLPASLRGGRRVGKRDDRTAAASNFRRSAAADRFGSREGWPDRRQTARIGQPPASAAAPPRASRAPARRALSCRGASPAAGEPLDPDPHQPDPVAGGAAPRTAPRRSRRSRGPRRSGRRSVRDRLTVRKSANRTLIDDRAPGLAGPAQPLADLVGQRQQRPADHRRVGHVDVEGHLGADRLLHVLGRRPAAGRGPRPARAGARRPPRRARPQHPERRLGHVADRASARAGAASRPSAPPRPTARRPAAGAGTPAPGRRGTTSMPSGLARVEPSLATNLVDATPTEQVSRCSSATRRRISAAICGGRAEQPPARRPRRGTPRRTDSGSTSGVTSRKIAITARDASA